MQLLCVARTAQGHDVVIDGAMEVSHEIVFRADQGCKERTERGTVKKHRALVPFVHLPHQTNQAHAHDGVHQGLVSQVACISRRRRPGYREFVFRVAKGGVMRTLMAGGERKNVL